MAIKLSSLTLSKRIPNLVSLNAHLSSISCAINFQSTQESEQSQYSFADFEAKIQFLKNKLHPDSLVSVLDSTPDLNSSVKLFKWASLQKRFQHTADTYHTMILKLGMAGNVEEMEGYCNEMVREKCCGFDKSLLALIDSFVSNNRLSEALRVLYVMNSSSFKPSVGIFNALMCALVEAKRDFKDVLFVYKEMVKAGIVPNVDTLNYLLEALFESGRVDTAIDQYRRMDKKGCSPNIRTFEVLISGLAARNRVDESIVMLEEMLQCGCEPGSSFYIRVIPLFCGLQNLKIGLKLFKMMRASNMAPDSVTYEAMIQCLCVHLQMDDAVKLFEEMINSSLSPDHQVYVDIINGFCKLNKFVDAQNFLEERNIMDTCLYNALLGSCCDNGEFTMAKDMFDKMSRGNMTDAKSWNILIRFLCENAVINKALEYLCRMVVSSFHPDSATYSALVLGNCKMGNIADALDLFHHIRSKYWVLDSVSYAEFVECLCQRGIIQEATEVFCYMSAKYIVLIDSLWREGYKSEASHLLDIMLEKGWVPDASTHALLMGSVARYEVVSRKSTDENFGVQDNVSRILQEGLGKT
ncbi:hypothetical protein CDL12_12526 [Handroanthus impetiginosus]|uniref:Pentacotripeptide-repeat region of PRORP domain-containing protein n=1 Tax=Handroanthus impetiginosus TaxID=429701 RepID=A0A2G9HC11_9LAMI|nr:hypothetical protein CDL12_12526 [Handroanthus impetiginosus]